MSDTAPEASNFPGSEAWAGTQRTTVAILMADLVESVRLYEAEPESTARRWRRFVHQVMNEVLPAHAGGRMVRHLGDGMLITCEDAPSALRCAFLLHETLADYNAGHSVMQSMFLRIGLHVDTVLVDELDAFGYGVNLTARLLGLAGPAQTVASTEFRDRVVHGMDADFEDLGLCYLKHLEHPVRAYRVARAGDSGMVAASHTHTSDQLPPPDPAQLRPTLAVLPFDTAAANSDARIAADLVVDKLLATLSRGARLRVVSRLSTAPLRGRMLGPPLVGHRLGAAYVVSGRLNAHGHRVSLVAELTDVRSGSVLWAESIQGDLAQLFTADDELVNRLASGICETIVRGELSRVRQSPLPTLASYSLLLAGVALMHRFGSDDFAHARECLTALIERVPRHAEPYAWLARWHVFRTVQGWTDSPDEERARARDLCRRALDLDPDSALALTVAGSVKVSLEKDLEGARESYRDALAIDPSEPLAHLLLGTTCTFKGEGEDAMRHAEMAIRLSPLDPMRFYFDSHAAAAALSAGQLQRAIELAERSLCANRLYHTTLRTLAIAQSLAGRADAARHTVRRILSVEPGLTAQRFLAGSPGGQFDIGQRFAEALVRAGLPEGTEPSGATGGPS